MELRRSCLGVALLALSLCLFSPADAFAVGDASTRFSIYVPPNNAYSSRASLLVVTSLSAEANSVLITDDATDGDDDDTVSVVLTRGQSHVVRIAAGAVNDDVGGIRDGDYFHVEAEHPVVVQMATTSNWQHDWLPSEGGGSRGQSFFVYSPPTSGADADVNVYAYEDDTRVTVSEISVATTTSGTTSVDLDAAVPVLDVMLSQGEDLIVRENGLGLDILDPGRTYWIQATRPVTAQYGHLGQVTGGNQARDGAGYVPSANGSTTGSLFFFSVPHNPGLAREKEVRITCFADDTTVELWGATSESTEWSLVSTSVVQAGGHLDFVGRTNSAFRDSDLYRLRTVPAYRPCNVFEGNWMETGSYGTSDFATAVASEGGRNIGHRFYAYIGPPGRQENVAHPTGERTNISGVSRYASHLYVVSAYDGANVTVTDVDTGGGILSHSFQIEAGEYYDLVIDRATYDAMNREGRRPYVHIAAAQPVAVVNGNFNDNWMAFLHSSIPNAPVASIDASVGDVACAATTTVTMECDNPSSLALDALSATLSIPDGLDATSLGGGTLSSDGRTLTFTGATLGAGATRTFSATLTRSCPAGSCGLPNLAALTVECRGQSAGVPYASVATEPLSFASGVRVDAFAALDVPDYGSSPPRPRVALELALSGVGTPTVRLLRATSDADPQASQTTLSTLTPTLSGASTSYFFEDEYALHYERTRFYRLEIEQAGCVEQIGPVAVTTSSGGSGGETSGLESNGTLGAALARRELSRSSLVGPVVNDEATLGAAVAALGGGALHALLPAIGPADSTPVDVTPTDLLALTNAWEVASADYFDDDARRAASVLLLETRGEVYDHQKTLCDRASGATIDSVDHRGFAEYDGGAWLRAAVRDERAGTGEYAIELKLYEASDGSWDGYSRWLRHDYPAPAPDQRVLNVQVWSARPGLEVTLLQQILEPLDVRWHEGSTGPAAYFAHGATLGPNAEVSIAGDGTDLRVRATVRGEDGELRDVELGPAERGDSRLALVDPFLDLTVDLVDGAGRVVDSMWMSDGAWAPYEDAMWGGRSVTSRFEPHACQLDDDFTEGLVFSGCAEVEVTVDDTAGVARHFGGARAPIPMGDFAALRFLSRSSADVEVCLEVEVDGVRRPFCDVVSGSDEPTEHVLALSELHGPDGCAVMPTAGATAHLATFAVHAQGAGSLAVDGLALVRRPRNAPAASRTHCVSTDASRVVERAGTGCQVGPASTTPTWLFVILISTLALGRRRLMK